MEAPADGWGCRATFAAALTFGRRLHRPSHYCGWSADSSFRRTDVKHELVLRRQRCALFGAAADTPAALALGRCTRQLPRPPQMTRPSCMVSPAARDTSCHRHVAALGRSQTPSASGPLRDREPAPSPRPSPSSSQVSHPFTTPQILPASSELRTPTTTAPDVCKWRSPGKERPRL